MSNRVIPLDSNKTFKVLSTNEGYNNPSVIIESTNEGNTGVYLDLYTNKTFESANDDIASVSFSGKDGSIPSNKMEYGRITGNVVTKGLHGSVITKVLKSGTMTTAFKVDKDGITIPFGLKDSSNSPGSSGQILSSLGSTGIQWINASGGGGSTGLAGVLSISNNAGSTGIDMNNQDIYYINSIGNTGGTLDFGSDVNNDTTLTVAGSGAFKVTSANDSSFSDNPAFLVQSTNNTTGGAYIKYSKVNTGGFGSNGVAQVSYFGTNTSDNPIEVSKKVMVMTVPNTGGETAIERYYYIDNGDNGSVAFNLSRKGIGNDCGNLSFSTSTNGDATYTRSGTGRFVSTAPIKPDGGIQNTGGSTSLGVSGQLLSSTGAGVQWIDSTLATVLDKGNNAGSTGINMNNQTITNTASIGNTGATLAFGSTTNANTTLTAGGTGAFVVTGSGIGYNQPIMSVQGSDSSGNTGVFFDIYNTGNVGDVGDVGTISFSSYQFGSKTQIANIRAICDNNVKGIMYFNVTDGGATVDNQMEIGPAYVKIVNALQDSSSSSGTSGQILSSTGTGISWINNAVPSGYAEYTTSSTVPNDVSFVVSNRGATNTLTLPTATSGKMLMIKTIQAFTVVSASSNVIPQIGGAAGTAILGATDGQCAILVGNGTNWVIMSRTNPV